MRLYLILSIIIVALLSGCAEEGPPEGDALRGVDPAEAAAQEWASDAFLVAALTQEKPGETKGPVGDGIAEVWGYLFESDQGEGHVAIGVSKDGKVVAANAFDVPAAEHRLVRPFDGGAPLGEWTVGSAEVGDVLADTLPGYRDFMEQDDIDVVMVLFQDEAHGGPVWAVEVREVERTAQLALEARIDAVTGEFLQLRGDPRMTGEG